MQPSIRRLARLGRMINKAFDNDLVSGDTLKAFKKVKKLLKRNSNARKKIITTGAVQGPHG